MNSANASGHKLKLVQLETLFNIVLKVHVGMWQRKISLLIRYYLSMIHIFLNCKGFP